MPQAIDNIKDLVEDMPQMTNVKEKELAFKASRKVLEAAGILNAVSPSPTVVNIFQQNCITLHPIVEQALARLSAPIPEPDEKPNYDTMRGEE